MKYMNIIIFINLKIPGSILSPKHLCSTFLENMNELLGVQFLVSPMEEGFQTGLEAQE